MNKQSVNSDASDVEGALTQSGQESGPAPKTENKLASNDPKTMAGYEKLGVAGPAHTGKPTATDNRGEGY